MADVKIYSIEVVKESRGIVQVEAVNEGEAYEEAESLGKKDKVDWAQEDHIITSITGVRDKEEEAEE